jgi:hypothetical protein
MNLAAKVGNPANEAFLGKGADTEEAAVYGACPFSRHSGILED